MPSAELTLAQTRTSTLSEAYDVGGTRPPKTDASVSITVNNFHTLAAYVLSVIDILVLVEAIWLPIR